MAQSLMEHHTELSASRVRWLVIVFALTIVAMGFEMAHYLIGTALGSLDQYPSAWANVHPLCKEEGGPYNLRCPFPGYNSIPLLCLYEACSSFDPKMKPLTEAVRAANLAAIRQDQINSLTVEAPYAETSPGWRAHAFDLRRGGIDLPRPVELNHAPATMSEAQRIVEWRSLDVSRSEARSWLERHEK